MLLQPTLGPPCTRTPASPTPSASQWAGQAAPGPPSLTLAGHRLVFKVGTPPRSWLPARWLPLAGAAHLQPLALRAAGAGHSPSVLLAADAAAHPLQDQYLEVTTSIPASSRFFGLGERTPSTGMELLKEGLPLTLWNRDQPAAGACCRRNGPPAGLQPVPGMVSVLCLVGGRRCRLLPGVGAAPSLLRG